MALQRLLSSLVFLLPLLASHSLSVIVNGQPPEEHEQEQQYKQGARTAAETAAPPFGWPAAVTQAKAIVKQMTLDDMNAMTTTYLKNSGSACTFTRGFAKGGFPGYCYSDGPAGVRAVDFTNAYPAGLSVAASFHTALAYERGLYLGEEFRAKGVQVAFAPVVEPLGRVAKGGRNWEGFGADPYLAGALAAETVQGMQKNVIATIKHFVGYEQETTRSPLGSPTAYSSVIDDRTLREIYMWPFQDAVRANVACVMCSYNRFNGTYACQSPTVLKKLLKDELAFPGFVISDSFAQHAFSSANAGLDVALNGGVWENGALAQAVRKGKLPRSRLEDMATRIIASSFKVFGAARSSGPAPGSGIPYSLLEPHAIVDGRSPASKPTLLQAAIEGHVLVKNMNNALPLKRPKFLSLYGYNSLVPAIVYSSDNGFGKWQNGIEAQNISVDAYTNAQSGLGIKNPPQAATLGNLITGGGSGSGTPSFISDPYSAILQQAQVDDTYLQWDFSSEKPSVNPASTACLVFINDIADEGYDRVGLADPASDALVKNVAAQCKNTIVVLHNNGIRVVDAWIENKNVTAVLFAHTPGQVSGQALVEILYGKVSPSGRLPYTVPKKSSDFGSVLDPCPPRPVANPVCTFSEGELIDYRRFLAKGITPRYAFGYGLTYSKFKYSNMAAKFFPNSTNAPTNPPSPKNIAPGGIVSLFDSIAKVTATITNTGKVAAAEVPQLYVQFPTTGTSNGDVNSTGNDKLRFLRGFSKLELAPGRSAQVMFTLTRRDLSRWNTKAGQWQLQDGTYTLFVGPNVEDVSLKSTIVRAGSASSSHSSQLL